MTVTDCHEGVRRSDGPVSGVLSQTAMDRPPNYPHIPWHPDILLLPLYGLMPMDSFPTNQLKYFVLLRDDGQNTSTKYIRFSRCTVTTPTPKL